MERTLELLFHSEMCGSVVVGNMLSEKLEQSTNYVRCCVPLSAENNESSFYSNFQIWIETVILLNNVEVSITM